MLKAIEKLKRNTETPPHNKLIDTKINYSLKLIEDIKANIAESRKQSSLYPIQSNIQLHDVAIASSCNLDDTSRYKRKPIHLQTSSKKENEASISSEPFYSDKKQKQFSDNESLLKNEVQELLVRLNNKNNEIDRLELDRSTINTKHENERNILKEENQSMLRENQILQRKLHELTVPTQALHNAFTMKSTSIINIIPHSFSSSTYSFAKLIKQNTFYKGAEVEILTRHMALANYMSVEFKYCQHKLFTTALDIDGYDDNSIINRNYVFSQCETSLIDEEVQYDGTRTIQDKQVQIQSLNEEIELLKKQLDSRDYDNYKTNSKYYSSLSSVAKRVATSDQCAQCESMPAYTYARSSDYSLCRTNTLQYHAGINILASKIKGKQSDDTVHQESKCKNRYSNESYHELAVKLIGIASIAQSEIGSLHLYLKRPMIHNIDQIIETSTNKIETIKNEIHCLINGEFTHQLSDINCCKQLLSSKIEEVDRYLTQCDQTYSLKIEAMHSQLNQLKLLCETTTQESEKQKSEIQLLSSKLVQETQNYEICTQQITLAQHDIKQYQEEIAILQENAKAHTEMVAKKDKTISDLIRKLNMVESMRCESEKKCAMLHERIVALEINYDHKIKENCQLADTLRSNYKL